MGQIPFQSSTEILLTPNFKKHFDIFSDYFLNFEKIKLIFLINPMKKNILIGQKIRENSASVFVKTLRVLNCYLVKLQLYKCGI